MAEGASSNRVHVLLIPFPAPGHLLPLLDLAHVLSSRHGLAVTVAVTPDIRPLLSPLLARSPAVEPLVLPFPDYSSLHAGRENAMDISRLPAPILLHVLGGLHEPLLRWARACSEPPTAIVSDFFVGWSSRLADELVVPQIVFNPSGAAGMAVFNSLWRRVPRRSKPDDDNELLDFPSLPKSPAYRWYQISGVFRSYVPGDPVSEFVKESCQSNLGAWGQVFNTFSELELEHLEHIKEDLGHSRVWAVGPLATQVEGGAAERGGSSSLPVGELMSWLDSQDEGSVVYVAFGSGKVLSPEQARVVAIALERSGSKFVWSARGATPVPEGFEARVGSRGVVIRDWAPQVAILNHDAVSVFLSHCGWNSVLEATAAGVALLMWPMGADQFVDARLLMEDVGTGVVVCDGGADATPDPDELARILAESVGGEAGKEWREKALEMKEKAARAVQEGGSSYMNLDAMVEELHKAAAAKSY